MEFFTRPARSGSLPPSAAHLARRFHGPASCPIAFHAFRASASLYVVKAILE